MLDRKLLEDMRRLIIQLLNLLDRALGEVPTLPSREEKDYLYKCLDRRQIPDHYPWLNKIIRK